MAVLTITPIGSSKEKAIKAIKNEIRPKRFTIEESVIYADAANTNRFPLPFLYVTWCQIDIQWWFTGDGYLIDVKVAKQAHGM